MLTDPLAVTYDGSAKTLPVIAGRHQGVSKLLGFRHYGTADGEFVAKTTRYLLQNKSFETHIDLMRVSPDADSDPFTGEWSALPNGFGFTYTVNPYQYATTVDIPRLRTALLAFVSSATELRLIRGEL